MIVLVLLCIFLVVWFATGAIVVIVTKFSVPARARELKTPQKWAYVFGLLATWPFIVKHLKLD